MHAQVEETAAELVLEAEVGHVDREVLVQDRETVPDLLEEIAQILLFVGIEGFCKVVAVSDPEVGEEN